MAYTPRLTAPSTTDPHWIKISYGGYNNCLLRNSTTGSVLPNCTGYVHGRWMEIGGVTKEYNLSFQNADTYFNHADGYSRGQEPKIGGIMCWNYSGGGHVAVVEQIISNDEIVCSESDYSGTRFVVRHRSRSTGWNITGRTNVLPYQGCIYHPALYDEGEEPEPTPEPGPEPTEPTEPTETETGQAVIFYPILKKLILKRQ